MPAKNFNYPEEYMFEGVMYNDFIKGGKLTLKNGGVINLKGSSPYDCKPEAMFDGIYAKEYVSGDFSKYGYVCWAQADYHFEFTVTKDCIPYYLPFNPGTSYSLAWRVLDVTDNKWIYIPETSDAKFIQDMVWRKMVPGKLLKDHNYKFYPISNPANPWNHANVQELWLATTERFIFKSRNKYYNFNDESYNDNSYYNHIQDTSYINLYENGISLISILETKNINGETFKPIEKINKFRVCKLVEPLQNK